MALDQVDEIAVFCHDDRVRFPGRLKDDGIGAVYRHQVPNVRSSRHKDRVINLSRRILQASSQILRLQVWQLVQNLLRRQSGGKEVKDVRHPDAHSANAGPSPALFGIDRDPGS